MHVTIYKKKGHEIEQSGVYGGLGGRRGRGEMM